MNDLTPEHRKRVAEAVTGNSYMIVTTGPNGGGMPLIAEEINPDDPGALWKPHKKSDQWKALVTWLSGEANTFQWTMMQEIINEQDTERMEYMVLEILEAQDDRKDTG